MFNHLDYNLDDIYWQLLKEIIAAYYEIKIDSLNDESRRILNNKKCDDRFENDDDLIFED